jgi:hypothetical protein
MRPGVASVLEFYIAGRCPGGDDTGGKFARPGDPNCGRRKVDVDDKIEVKEPNSVEKYVLDKVRNEPSFVEKRSGPASKRRFELKNGWVVVAKRLKDGSYHLSIDVSKGSPGDAGKGQP